MLSLPASEVYLSDFKVDFESVTGTHPLGISDCADD
jgi:hypothetical protein